MAFTPSSTIYLCGVPFDNTYKNQIYFANATEQNNYFTNRVKKTFTDYLTVRKTLSNGQLQSSVKVSANIDDLYNCNYMFYRNANHGTKIFYAFIKNLVYINEGTTEVIFETDVYQTWLFDVTIKDSYVVREHSKTDGKGDNVVPESFACQDYDYYQLPESFTNIGRWGYLVASTEKVAGTASRGVEHSGIYQGIYFYFLTQPNGVNDLLDKIEEEAEDSILFIAVVPEFCVSAGDLESYGAVEGSKNPASKIFEINGYLPVAFSSNGFTYTPRNKKLWTAPYFKVYATNHAGEQAEYCVEDFTDSENIVFKMYGDVSANPSLTLIPQDYKGIANNVDAGISISGFPQCSFNSDTFKLWLAKNQYSLGMSALTGVGEIVAGVASVATGAGVTVGAGLIVHGATGVINTINNTYQASREPNKTSAGAPKNNLLTAMGCNKFDIGYQMIKSHYAKTIDDYFTMYGYQTNKVKIPNVATRPYFNYVQTVDINIIGDIPCDDMNKLKEMYNSGVTLWKSTATVGDYSIDNSPK